MVKTAVKRPVSMWQWVGQFSNGSVGLTPMFYRTKAEAQKAFWHCTIFGKAEWTRIRLTPSTKPKKRGIPQQYICLMDN